MNIAALAAGETAHITKGALLAVDNLLLYTPCTATPSKLGADIDHRSLPYCTASIVIYYYMPCMARESRS